ILTMERKAICRLAVALGLLCAGTVADAAGRPIVSDVDGSGAKTSAAPTSFNRYELVGQILERWQPVAAELGQNPETWREIFSTQLGLMDESNVATLAAVGVDGESAQASYARFTQAFRNASMQAYMKGGISKTQTKLGSTTTDQVFIPITPCRV